MARSPIIVRRLYTPAEVSKLFYVHPKTVTRWARNGILPCVFTLGGHRRFDADQVDAMLARE